MPQYGIRCLVDKKNQTTSDHPSSNVQSQSSISITKSGPNIKEMSLRRRSMIISKYQPNLKHLSKQGLSNTTSDLMASGWSLDTGRNVGQGDRVIEMKRNQAQIPNNKKPMPLCIKCDMYRRTREPWTRGNQGICLWRNKKKDKCSNYQ